MDSSRQKIFIDKIREEKLRIGATTSNRWTKMLDEESLYRELYQKDMHVFELLQDAEEYDYGDGVEPSLELVMTDEDIARVGARSTLIIFKNGKGFDHRQVKAWCKVKIPNTNARRQKAYVGKKGSGFGVFLISRCPHIVSNGFRVRFDEQPGYAQKMGYVLPKWVDIPSKADLRRIYGSPQLPRTVIVLPIRDDKVDIVRVQLDEIPPEVLLFLSRLCKLTIRDYPPGEQMGTYRSTLVPSGEYNNHASSIVKLSVHRGLSGTSQTSLFYLVKSSFPVLRPMEEETEANQWIITLAFPFADAPQYERRYQDIYASFPSAAVSGFPFLINADFLLVSSRTRSRKTIKFDNWWNKGILSNIPSAFVMAFDLLLQKSQIESSSLGPAPILAVQHAYFYIPTYKPLYRQLRPLQQQIIDLLRQRDVVLVDTYLGQNLQSPANFFCMPSMARTMHPEFRSILEKAWADDKNNVNPTLLTNFWYVVDRGLQDRHNVALKVLGVPAMGVAEYLEYLNQPSWLLGLREDLYWELVYFCVHVVKHLDRHSTGAGEVNQIPLIKYCGEDGSVALASLRQTIEVSRVRIIPAEPNTWVDRWTEALKPWIPLLFMPNQTKECFMELPSYRRISLSTVVSELSVGDYLQQVINTFACCSDPDFLVSATIFMLESFEAKYLSRHGASRIFSNGFRIVDNFGEIQVIKRPDTIILAPAAISQWPKLDLSSWYPGAIVLSEDYFPNVEDRARFQDPGRFRTFFVNIMGVVDILDVAVKVDVPVPQVLLEDCNIESANLLLKWLARSTQELQKPCNALLHSLQGTKWLTTEMHGLERPSDCVSGEAFSYFFKHSDVPFLDSRLACFGDLLSVLGVNIDAKKSSAMVARHLQRMVNESACADCYLDDPACTVCCSLERATRYYSFLQQFGWRPPVVESSLDESVVSMKVFVPGSLEDNVGNRWERAASCVIGDSDDFFDESLQVTVLKGLYPRHLFPFFSKVLGVPKRVSVEKYCQLWMRWRANGRECNVEDYCGIWNAICRKWQSCDDEVWEKFRETACVPSVAHPPDSRPSVLQSKDIILSLPSQCLIPDNPDLRCLFSGHPDMPNFVWYPDKTYKTERMFTDLYGSLGVMKLSAGIKERICVSGLCGRQGQCQMCKGRSKRKLAVDGVICKGLIKAVLGFLARPKYELSSIRRKKLVLRLTEIEEVRLAQPFSVYYDFSWPASESIAVVSENSVKAHLHKGKLYCLDRNDTALRDRPAWRDYRAQLAKALSQGLLGRHWIAEELEDFLIPLIDYAFDMDGVDHELRRKKAKVCEDEFLAILPIIACKRASLIIRNRIEEFKQRGSSRK